jgi:hypothetical protein
MAHSFDVFDAAGTHACSCQSNGGLARNITRKYMHAETLALLTKPLYFPNVKYLK